MRYQIMQVFHLSDSCSKLQMPDTQRTLHLFGNGKCCFISGKVMDRNCNSLPTVLIAKTYHRINLVEEQRLIYKPLYFSENVTVKKYLYYNFFL